MWITLKVCSTTAAQAAGISSTSSAAAAPARAIDSLLTSLPSSSSVQGARTACKAATTTPGRLASSFIHERPSCRNKSLHAGAGKGYGLRGFSFVLCMEQVRRLVFVNEPASFPRGVRASAKEVIGLRLHETNSLPDTSLIRSGHLHR